MSDRNSFNYATAKLLLNTYEAELSRNGSLPEEKMKEIKKIKAELAAYENEHRDYFPKKEKISFWKRLFS